jgi:hypothetical protein
VGNPTSVCGANGNWSPAPSCECESHIITYDLTGDYYIFAPVIQPFSATAGVNIPEINTQPLVDATMQLRFSANGDAVGDGPASLVAMELPLEFIQMTSLGEGAFIHIQTDVDARMPARACGYAQGALSGTQLDWGACDAGPSGTITNFTSEESLDPDGPGCARGYNSAGVITCENGTNRLLQCMSSGGLAPLPALNVVNGVWDQKLVPLVFDDADLATSGFRLGNPGQSLTGVAAASLVGTHLLIPNTNPGTATFIALRGTVRSVDFCAPAPTSCTP